MNTAHPQKVTALGWLGAVVLMLFVSLLIGGLASMYTRSVKGFEIATPVMLALMLVGVVATMFTKPVDPEVARTKMDPKIRKRLDQIEADRANGLPSTVTAASLRKELVRASMSTRNKRAMSNRRIGAFVAAVIVFALFRLAGASQQVAIDAGTVVAVLGIGAFFLSLMRMGRNNEAVLASVGADERPTPGAVSDSAPVAPHGDQRAA